MGTREFLAVNNHHLYGNHGGKKGTEGKVILTKNKKIKHPKKRGISTVFLTTIQE